MLHNYDDFGGGKMQGAPQVPRNTLLSVDQQLQLMNTINNMVRASQFTSQLANTIFTLCAQLKTSGSMLEQSHKNELNKVFTSLRQACCRDNGQLGTPCRLKIMELVELRAMNWRTNLAHSQYYVNRPEGQHDPAPTVGIPPSATSPPTQVTSSVTSPVPSSPQPPMQFVPQNPMMFQDPMAANHNAGGIFFIPAASTWMNPLMPMPPNPFLPHSMIPPDHQMFLRQRSLNKKPNNLMNKTLQLRHEMIIRNSDSGKIMGVKGRRVAAVEQLTNTVISFQKVDSKSKERTLTITASTMEDIERAKDMIIDTIRRNMSPMRTDMSIPPPNQYSGMSSENQSIPSQQNTANIDEDDDDDDEDIKLEQTSDGKLTFHCDDPELLAAAQEALSAYLRVRARPSAEEREKKKERRKSMPLQQTARDQQEPVMLKPAKTFHGSTPNLADGLAATTTVVVASIPQPMVPNVHASGDNPIRYNRDTLMTARDTKRAPIPDEMLQEINRVAPDILIA
ncbi:Eukaryotic translation initiation factor 4E-binding protein Mextli homolog [Caenorhabditis elegans]|uniref:Eukaryotic translation initiation factor 4E-binding protein Mextli homolog n=1 Tax=Caenorhabditis elegans TaxID=6239 RepID=MXT_CAEEL|nr:Eukaryotic translation initiation factor 4E-binding protein Mextli homolog [Caenorhabditis elegans]Q9XW13.1 RecName: Full=Eukaryotic translation initiation factor 4E-binding protein Mextli homolog [Caenorhabditis elegans]CAA22321.1 Eukaryotic translation initiation factor 4E-binding protein Mextli homolog [Caenorhabditis elegans]|eukprot:NP_493246.1 Eukaryotic translation initiation factor 4E-binding protein Mextli homolog [Caenorhabditis elegans]